MDGSLENIHRLQFLGIARGNLKLGAGLVIIKVSKKITHKDKSISAQKIFKPITPN